MVGVRPAIGGAFSSEARGFPSLGRIERGNYLLRRQTEYEVRSRNFLGPLLHTYTRGLLAFYGLEPERFSIKLTRENLVAGH
jgi:hypothetical protein